MISGMGRFGNTEALSMLASVFLFVFCCPSHMNEKIQGGFVSYVENV